MIYRLNNFLIFTIIYILFGSTSLTASIYSIKNDNLSKKKISAYLNGSVLLNDKKYSEANIFFSKAQGLSSVHNNYNSQYVFSLVANGKINDANKILSGLDNAENSNTLFKFTEGVYLLNSRNYFLAKKKFQSIKSNNILFRELNNYILLWLEMSLSRKKKIPDNFQTSFENIKLIQSLLLYEHIQNSEFYLETSEEILKKKQLGRYHFFHIIYLIKKNNIDQAKEIVKNQLLNNPNNLLMKQSYIALDSNDLNFFTRNYESSNINHGISELLYLFANLFQQREQIELSKFFASLSNYLNPNFAANKILNFQNALNQQGNIILDNQFLNDIASLGEEYFWYINFKKLALIEEKSESKNKIIINDLKKSLSKNKYFNFSKLMDMGNYYRSIKKYSIAIDYYNQAEQKADQRDLNWRFYYFRGICNERLKNWSEAESDLLQSLKHSPKEYRVMNYIAYSWLERGVYYSRAIKMLNEAVQLSNWEHGYIIDSLGWGYYLLNDFKKAETLLELAYTKTPSEAEVYDHYADALWKNNKKIQARYVWNKAFQLESIDEKRAKKINQKLLNGIN
jgi:tetratricopeptide (TPR) repeat protein